MLPFANLATDWVMATATAIEAAAALSVAVAAYKQTAFLIR
jgi:hypothetical protein